MDQAIRTRLDTNDGVAGVTELVGLLGSRGAVDRAIASGELLRLRRDAVVDAARWASAAAWDRHALRARAVVRSLGDGVALSHHSSLALHHLPLHGVDDQVHVVRRDVGRGRSSGGVVRHAAVPEAFVAQVDGIPAVSPALACLQVADAFGVEAGLVSADAVLRSGVSRKSLQAAAAAGRFGRGAAHVRVVSDLADGAIESAGESRVRWVLTCAGLADDLEAQVWIEDGGFRARVDFLLRRAGVIVEFDGLLKYATHEALRAEKLREDRLRELGYEVVRLTWADLARPDRVVAKVRAACARSVARGA
jgi:very-short-patch-repair endonuclease